MTRGEMLSIKEFRNHWEILYGKTLPLGYRLREAFPSRWFRIHTLPESKRYPETESETLEILRRHNTVLSDLLEPESDIVFVTTTYSFQATPEPPDAEYALENLEKLEWLRTEVDDEVYSHFWVSQHVWTPGMLDSALRKVMNDEMRFIISSMGQKCVYAPYDGGADIITELPEQRNAMKEKYSSWLSVHPKGL